jgi:hypothetical protein
VNLLIKKEARSCKRVILIIECKDVREKDANRKANINTILNKLYYSYNIIKINKINNVNKVKA